MKRATPTIVEIDLDALRFNYRQLKKGLPSHVRALCVVKSNAYGHGAQRVAKALQEEGAEFFGTGTVDEAIELRESGVKRPILILLGICNDHFEALSRYQLTPVLYDLKTAEQLNACVSRSKKKIGVHIKVDTGMTRLGVLPAEFEEFCRGLKRLTSIEPVGLMTHLAEAGDAGFTARQFREFKKVREVFEEQFPTGEGIRLYHVANSQAIIDGFVASRASVGRSPSEESGKIGATQMRGAGGERLSPPGKNVWLGRMGIALYGSYPLERDRKLVELKPVLSWKTQILAVKDVPPKTSISYNRTFVTKRASRIGILPVGYADGYPRLLSNRSRVLVGGKSAPVTGNVCMDLMMVDLTGIPDARVGSEVVLIGRQGKEEIQAEELAKQAETISYEIFCRISSRVPRLYR